jgi:hypothetical protein
MQTISGRFRAMHIPLPNGDTLIPDAEFGAKVGATRRTMGNWDKEGCPYTHVAGMKYRPVNEGLEWIASRIKRRNPRRARPRKTERAAGEAA